MNEVTLEEEKRYWKQGFSFVAGIDEVGRGPLAGPVVCSGVIFSKNDHLIRGINDSKRLSREEREYFFPVILNRALEVTVCIIDEGLIDHLNIHNATVEGMRNCINMFKRRPEIVLVDGYPFSHHRHRITGIIKGDTKVMSIAAASIVAKVVRDGIMCSYHLKYRQYGFNKNSGYPTKYHKEAIKKYGVLPIHRRSFSPVKAHLI